MSTKKIQGKCWALFIFACLYVITATGNPRTLMSAEEVDTIRAELHTSPSFLQYVNETAERTHLYFDPAPDVPIPVDPGGGYTHETHKQNGIAIYEAGMLYLFTGEQSYATYASELLLKYADLYPTLGQHPVKRSNTPGQLFWQVLNESVFMVYVVLGYDAIRADLDTATRRVIEENLLRPLADFLSDESAYTFNRIHNHAAWAVAGVGTLGYVIDEKHYVDIALKGTELNGEAGFYALIDNLFSPDGYYTEGPYYQRYALMPFILFARVIEENEPAREIFAYRDSLLPLAVYTCIDLSYNGLFFPLNDAIKDKGLNTVELRYGVSVVYHLTADDQLLDIANVQDGFVLTADSYRYAKAIDEGKAQPFQYKTRLIRDGPDGKGGVLGILRDDLGGEGQTAVFKATSHGFGHGHFDRLNWLYFDNGREIISDYGGARFLNIEQKEGGRYLPENTTWAKQTVAHNTVVVDEQSHFNGNVDEADRFSPSFHQFQDEKDIKLVRSWTTNPYTDIALERVIAFVTGLSPDRYVVVDIFNVQGEKKHTFDLPLHYQGHFLATTNESKTVATEQLQPLGKENGYQHLWQQSEHQVPSQSAFGFTWINHNRFYTVHSWVNQPTKVFFARLGANDPHFNLRSEQVLLRRVEKRKDAVFVSVLETHGEYNGPAEFTKNNQPLIEQISYFEIDSNQVVQIKNAKEQSYFIAFARKSDKQAKHKVKVGDFTLNWEGFAAVFNSNGEQI